MSVSLVWSIYMPLIMHKPRRRQLEFRCCRVGVSTDFLASDSTKGVGLRRANAARPAHANHSYYLLEPEFVCRSMGSVGTEIRYCRMGLKHFGSTTNAADGPWPHCTFSVRCDYAVHRSYATRLAASCAVGLASPRGSRSSSGSIPSGCHVRTLPCRRHQSRLVSDH